MSHLIELFLGLYVGTYKHSTYVMHKHLCTSYGYHMYLYRKRLAQFFNTKNNPARVYTDEASSSVHVSLEFVHMIS